VGARFAQAFADPDPDTGLRAARELARALQDCHPGAAASLREGLEEMFTVRRLGVGDRLARTLTSTNPVESMISIAPTTCRNVKRWKDGQMVCRWTAAGTLAAERSFRRVKGCKDMPALGRAGRSRRGGDHRTVCVGSARTRHPRSTTLGTSSPSWPDCFSSRARRSRRREAILTSA
jgi:putative transposase